VLADAAVTVFFALVPLPLVLADAATTTVCTRALHLQVLEEAATDAVLALPGWLLTSWCSQMPLPPQSSHWLGS